MDYSDAYLLGGTHDGDWITIGTGVRTHCPVLKDAIAPYVHPTAKAPRMPTEEYAEVISDAGFRIFAAVNENWTRERVAAEIAERKVAPLG